MASPINTMEPHADSTSKNIHIRLPDTDRLKVKLSESNLTDVSGTLGKSTKLFCSFFQSANPNIDTGDSAERSVPSGNHYLCDVCIAPNRLDLNAGIHRHVLYLKSIGGTIERRS